MTRADNWLGQLAPNPQSGTVEVRGNDTARLINARPATIYVNRRDPVTGVLYQLGPQVVRLEITHHLQGASEQHDDMMNKLSMQYVVLVGYKDDPVIADTDVQRADEFFYFDHMWEVLDTTFNIPGRLLATATLKP